MWTIKIKLRLLQQKNSKVGFPLAQCLEFPKIFDKVFVEVCTSLGYGNGTRLGGTRWRPVKKLIIGQINYGQHFVIRRSCQHIRKFVDGGLRSFESTQYKIIIKKFMMKLYRSRRFFSSNNVRERESVGETPEPVVV